MDVTLFFVVTLLVTLLECNLVLITKILMFCLPNTSAETEKTTDFPLNMPV